MAKRKSKGKTMHPKQPKFGNPAFKKFRARRRAKAH